VVPSSGTSPLALSLSHSLLLALSYPLSLTPLTLLPWLGSEVPPYSLLCSAIAKNTFKGAGEMAQRLRALTALPEVLSSIPSNHMVAHNHL